MYTAIYGNVFVKVYAAEEALQEIVVSSVEELLSFAESVNDGSMFGCAGMTVRPDALAEVDRQFKELV